jgi:hypothetical protein
MEAFTKYVIDQGREKTLKRLKAILLETLRSIEAKEASPYVDNKPDILQQVSFDVGRKYELRRTLDLLKFVEIN